MTDWSDDDHSRRRGEDEPARRWRAWSRRGTRFLSRRPAESWVFFAAGLILGGLLF